MPANDELTEEANKLTKSKPHTFLLLHFAVFILSVSTICAKLASPHEFMSIGFVLLYGGMIFALGIYALIWQQVLKKMPLTIAFANKAASLIWSLVWGVLIFNEAIAPTTIIGIFIVFAGVLLVVTGNNSTSKQEHKNE